jgi:hypothetical protein
MTTATTNWLDIGFAFAVEFGENGRDYFHRVSQIPPEYNDALPTSITTSVSQGARKRCDPQHVLPQGQGSGRFAFTPHPRERVCATSAECAKSADTSPAHIAETAVSAQKQPVVCRRSLRSPSSPLPSETFSTAITLVTYSRPSPLRTKTAICSTLGALCVLSSCLPHISGVYHGRRVYPNFFHVRHRRAYPQAKGVLTLCRHLRSPSTMRWHQKCVDEEKEYKKKMQEFSPQEQVRA